MKENSPVIDDICSFIKSNGDRFKPVFWINGIANPLPQVTIDSAKNQKGSLRNYLVSLINGLNPDKIHLTVKKPNGSTSSGKNPVSQTFVLGKNNNENQPLPTSTGFSGLGSPKTEGLPPQYAFQLEILRAESNNLKTELKEYKDEAKKYKDKYRELKLDYDTQEKSHQLDMKLAEVSGKNSLSGVVKEIMPTLQGIASEFIANKQPSQPEALGQVTDERVAGMVETIKQLKGEQIPIYFELMVRIGHVKPSEMLSFIEAVRKLTPNADQLFKQ